MAKGYFIPMEEWDKANNNFIKFMIRLDTLEKKSKEFQDEIATLKASLEASEKERLRYRNMAKEKARKKRYKV